MIILTVDENPRRLEELAGRVRALCPGAQVETMTDPLLAGKYAFFNRVDVLLSELAMHRMNGLKLMKMVRYASPAARVGFTGEAGEFAALQLTEGAGGVDALLTRPVAEARLAGLLSAPAAAMTGGAAAPRTVEEVYDQLDGSDELRDRLVQAALEDTLEGFFRGLGCSAELEEIQSYFQRRIFQSAELTESMLEMVTGGAAAPSFRGLILQWIQ